MNDDEPTELTFSDVEKFMQKLMTEEIRQHECFNCGEKYIHSYGHNLCECDECYFKRFPKEQVEEFFRSFF